MRRNKSFSVYLSTVWGHFGGWFCCLHLFPAEKLFSHSHMTLLAACLNVACVNMAATKEPERFHMSDRGQALGVCKDIVILGSSVQSCSDSDEHLLQICH